MDVLPDFQLEVPPLGDLARVQAWDLVLPVQLPCSVGQLPFPAGKCRTGRVGVFWLVFARGACSYVLWPASVQAGNSLISGV